MDDRTTITISIADIIGNLGGQIRRPFIEGENLLQNNHIVSVGVIAKNTTEVQIFGLVLQSSEPEGNPYEVNIKLREKFEDWSCKCSCEADFDQKCKHIFGVLLYLYRQKDIRIASYADVKEYWVTAGKEIHEQGCSAPISDLCCFKSNSNRKKSNPKLSSSYLDKLLEVAPNSIIAKHKTGHQKNA